MKSLASLQPAGLMALLFYAVAGAQVSAQEVHKCVVDGKTVYQAEACKSGDKVLKLEAPLSPERRAAAQKRRYDEVMNQHARQAEFDSAQRNEIYRNARPQTATVPDCAALNKQLGEAYGQRNGLRGSSDGMNADSQMAKINDKNMADASARINSTTQQLNQAGCKIN